MVRTRGGKSRVPSRRSSRIANQSQKFEPMDSNLPIVLGDISGEEQTIVSQNVRESTTDSEFVSANEQIGGSISEFTENPEVDGEETQSTPVSTSVRALETDSREVLGVSVPESEPIAMEDTSIHKTDELSVPTLTHFFGNVPTSEPEQEPLRATSIPSSSKGVSKSKKRKQRLIASTDVVHVKGTTTDLAEHMSFGVPVLSVQEEARLLVRQSTEDDVLTESVKQISMPDKGEKSRKKKKSKKNVEISESLQIAENVSNIVQSDVLPEMPSSVVQNVPDIVVEQPHDVPHSELVTAAQAHSDEIVEKKRKSKKKQDKRKSQNIADKDTKVEISKKKKNVSDGAGPSKISKASHKSGKSSGSAKFRSKQHAKYWLAVCKRTVIPERKLHESDFYGLGIVALLTETGWIGSVDNVSAFCKDIILEFYCNLSKTINEEGHSDHFKTFIRGKMIDFSPQIIADALGCSNEEMLSSVPSWNIIIKELTGEARTVWPRSESFPSSELSTKYSILHKISLRNWLPSSHRTSVSKNMAVLLFSVGMKTPLNLAQVMFDNIIRHAEVSLVKLPISYPSLIFQIIQSQCSVQLPSDIFSAEPMALRLSYRLFSGKHVADVNEIIISDDDEGLAAGVSAQPFPGMNASSVLFARTLDQLTSEVSFLTRQIKMMSTRKRALNDVIEDMKALQGHTQGESSIADGMEDAHPSDAY